MMKLSKEDSARASMILERMDKVAQQIQTSSESWGMPFEQAKELVNQLDAAADDFEKMAFGVDSFQRRQAEVIQQDADEGYMGSFEQGGVVQQDADEPYMSAYADDDSSGVRHGQSSTGRPLAP